MLAWLDNERVTRWIAILLVPFIVICYLRGFYCTFGEFGGGDGSLPEVISLLLIFAACGAALRSIRAQVNRERDERELKSCLGKKTP